MANSTSAEELINTDDFRSIELKISMTNVTTGTEIKDGMVIYGKKKQKTQDPNMRIKLIEFSDSGLILEVPKRSCARGHQLVLDIEAIDKNENKDISTTVVIEVVDHVEGNMDRIKASLIQTESKSWKEFLKIFSKRQDEIFDFFKSAKGF